MARRSEATIIKLIFWTIFLRSVIALNLPQSSAINSLEAIRFQQLPIARSLYDQYTLGQDEEGAKIIYTYQFTQTFDEKQKEISLDFHYPDNEIKNDSDEEENNDEDSLIITQIQLYVKVEDGAITQAYISDGGIGKNNISLQIITNHSNLLNYMLVIYGKAA